MIGCMRREIKTLFDFENAPYSNMVLGEVLNYPGKWSSYPPHHHSQPEVYFHRFDYPSGFGVSFANGEVYTSKHNGLTVINSGFHSQGTAPGYAMSYVWGIRHIEGDPWEKTRIDDKEHSWLWKADANEHIFKEVLGNVIPHLAEVNMIGIACGLSAVGFKPIVHTFGPFASRRCFDQIFLSGGYARNTITVIGTDPGVCAALNGGTHMPFEDMALYRAIPNAKVFDITDAAMLEDLLTKRKNMEGAKYIRVGRKNSYKV